MEEWEYLDEWHTTETINWIVAEKGTYNLACGSQLVVGTVNDMHDDWKEVDFSESFNGVPIVMS